ncbi:MAG: DeoR/GlpR transcriptional regulator, partial [Atopobium sp.]|nr:DeoR/GlpR transcriptional regulator [Atopobium sp.]
TDTGATDEQIQELKAAGLKDVVCVTPSILPAK